MSSLVAFQCEEGGDFPSVSLFHLLLLFFKGTDGGSVVKSPSAHAEDIGDADLIPGLGRSPGGGNGNPLQYSCLKIPTDRGAWRAIVHGLATRLSMHDG